MRQVEAAGLALEEAHGQHDAERDDEEDDEHRRRVEDRQVGAKALGLLPDHEVSTTQAAGGSTAVAASPCRTAGRLLGVDWLMIWNPPQSR